MVESMKTSLSERTDPSLFQDAVPRIWFNWLEMAWGSNRVIQMDKSPFAEGSVWWLFVAAFTRVGGAFYQ